MPRRRLNPVLAAVFMALAASRLVAQGTPACSAEPRAANPCPATTPAQQFPYPGEAKPAPAPNAPAAPANPAQQFPYPGEPKPAPGSSSSSSSDADSSSSSSSSSSSANPNDPDDPLDKPSPSTGNTVRRKLPKPTHLQSDEEREAEDVKVAKFYSDSGNLVGAYARLKDATRLISDDADAFFLLGEVSTHMGKTAEASTAYNKFLELEPDTRRARLLRRSMDTTQAKK